MIKVDIKMNRELICKEGEYDVEDILFTLDRCHAEYGFKKETHDDGMVTYWGKDDRDDFGYFGAIIMALKKEEWFTKYVDKWYWYNNSCMPYEDWFRQEDILKELGLGESA